MLSWSERWSFWSRGKSAEMRTFSCRCRSHQCTHKVLAIATGMCHLSLSSPLHGPSSSTEISTGRWSTTLEDLYSLRHCMNRMVVWSTKADDASNLRIHALMLLFFAHMHGNSMSVLTQSNTYYGKALRVFRQRPVEYYSGCYRSDILWNRCILQ